MLDLHSYSGAYSAGGASKGNKDLHKSISEVFPTLFNETEAALNGLLPASKAQLSALKAFVAVVDAKSASQEARIDELEDRLDNLEVGAAFGHSLENQRHLGIVVV